MICFIMNKRDKDLWLAQLFDLLYDNMSEIAPCGLSYFEQRQKWLAEVSQALDKEPRQILLCTQQDTLVGYIQYYTRMNILVVEEVQVLKAYQGTLAFQHMCRYLSAVIPFDINQIEAYADRRNLRSMRIMKKLGMVDASCPEDEYLHYLGPANRARELFG